MKHDLAILDNLPQVQVLGEHLDEIDETRSYSGRFVVTSDGKFFAKLFPALEADKGQFFHDMLVKELGVKDPESMDVKEVVNGGGKIEVRHLGDYVECRLFGKSTIYGDYDPSLIDTEAVGQEIQNAFDLADLDVSVIPDYEP
jgi:hypothetical protein